MKICTKCTSYLSEDMFTKRKDVSCGLSAVCKQCINAAARKYRLENNTLVNTREKAWKDANRDKTRYWTSEWASKNKAKRNAASSNRRAKEKQATPSWGDRVLIEEVFILAQLRTKLTGVPWHVDHIIPLNSPIVCGLHVEDNLQVILWRDNLKKSNKLSIDI